MYIGGMNQQSLGYSVAMACQLQKNVGGGGLTGQTELRASKMVAEIQGLETEKVAGKTFEKTQRHLGVSMLAEYQNHLIGETFSKSLGFNQKSCGVIP